MTSPDPRPPRPPVRRCIVSVDGVRCPEPPHYPGLDASSFCVAHEDIDNAETKAWRDRLAFDKVAAEVADRVQAENADRYVDLRIAVELADTRTIVVEEKDGMVEVYSLRASDWNRVVAVARGHMSQKARASLDAFVKRTETP